MPTLSAESNIADNQKGQALPDELLPQLSWSHYERLMRVENEVARNWYTKGNSYE